MVSCGAITDIGCLGPAGNALRRVEFTVKSGVEANDYSAVARKEHLEPLEIELRRLEDSVYEIHKEFLYQREREETMRDTNGACPTKWQSSVLEALLTSSRVCMYRIDKFACAVVQCILHCNAGICGSVPTVVLAQLLQEKQNRSGLVTPLCSTLTSRGN